MRVHVTTNAEPVGKFIRRLFRDQEPYARVTALNKTALGAQARQRRHMEGIFTVRNKLFISRAVKFKPRATKARPVATLRLEPPGGAERADILGKFETETEKRPMRGPTIAVPLPAMRRTGSGRASKKDKLSGRTWTRLTERIQVSEDLVRVMVTATTGVIYRRDRRGNTTPLYVLVASVPIVPELRFVENIQAEATRIFAAMYREAWEHALRTAR